MRIYGIQGIRLDGSYINDTTHGRQQRRRGVDGRSTTHIVNIVSRATNIMCKHVARMVVYGKKGLSSRDSVYSTHMRTEIQPAAITYYKVQPQISWQSIISDLFTVGTRISHAKYYARLDSRIKKNDAKNARTHVAISLWRWILFIMDVYTLLNVLV